MELKAEVVSANEYEGGLWRVLCLGHTIGHALEAETNYRTLLHGEAVAWGMIAAARVAAGVGKLKESDALRIRDVTREVGKLPKLEVRAPSSLRRLQSDRSTRNGQVPLG